jgi:tRNA(Ile)-lysidine synthase
VAASGGLDSTALLHATVAAAKALGLRVVALHVHHGLQGAADAAAERLAATCARWARRGAPVALAIERLAGRPARGESVEAWARRERRAALARMAKSHGAGLVLLAHHRGDQAETFLLQALRGGGPAGLAAMPREAVRDGLVWCRPWLQQPRARLEAYARRHRLVHVEDASNADPRFARNRLRQQVWPPLTEAFPDAEAVFAAASERAAEAAVALRELAALDHAACRSPHDASALDLVRLAALGEARRANLLRHWLAGAVAEQARLRAPPAPVVPGTLVQRLVLEARPGRGRSWPLGRWRVRAVRGRLVLEPVPVPAPDPMPAPAPAGRPSAPIK